MVRVLLILAACVPTAVAADPATLPEIERLKGAHQQAVAKIRSDAGKQLGPIRQNYLGRLRDLLKQIAAQGNDNATQAVLTEMERIEKGVEPTGDERRRMTGLLLASRVLYEKACGPALPAAIKAEADAKAALLHGLTELEARYAKVLEFNKIAAVKAERERLSQPAVPPPPIVTARPAPSDSPPEPKGALNLTAVDETFVDQLDALVGSHKGSPVTLSKKDVLVTQRTFRPPVDIAIEAMTDSTNLRIGYAADQIIFNWEMNMKQLRVDGGPAGGRHKSRAGLIPTHQFVNVRWLVTPSRQAVFVNGELRFEHLGDYSTIDKPIRIFPKAGSEVTVRSLKVKQLPAGTE